MDVMRSKLTLGERIHTARRRVDASQKELAAAINVSRQLVGKWESGDAIPDLIEAVRLARYTRTPLDWFTDDLIVDVRDQPEPNGSCNADDRVERPKLFDDSELVRRYDDQQVHGSGPLDLLRKTA